MSTKIRRINAKLVISQVCNCSVEEISDFVRQIICKAFEEEEKREFPRCKLHVIHTFESRAKLERRDD